MLWPRRASSVGARHSLKTCHLSVFSGRRNGREPAGLAAEAPSSDLLHRARGRLWAHLRARSILSHRANKICPTPAACLAVSPSRRLAVPPSRPTGARLSTCPTGRRALWQSSGRHTRPQSKWIKFLIDHWTPPVGRSFDCIRRAFTLKGARPKQARKRDGWPARNFD